MLSRAWKDRVLGAVGSALRHPPGASLARAYFRGRANIIFYHGIWAAGSTRGRLLGGLDLDAFAAHLRQLGTFFDFVDIETVLAPSAAGANGNGNSNGHGASGRPHLHVTFDDGLDLVGDGAAELMQSLGISATVFINTACVEGGHLMWQHALAAMRAMLGDAAFLERLNALQARTGGRPAGSAARQLEATRGWPMARKDEYTAELWAACAMPPLAEFLEEHRPYLGWDGLAAWTARGHRIGFHTHSHPFCSQLSAGEVDAEILEPGTRLRARLGGGTLPFAYPFGDRLVPEQEARVAASDTFSCLLGTGRFAPRGAAPSALDRVEAEGGINLEVFGRPLTRQARSSYY
jgi:peptidoglycan/xylan/chitin deacetylase (PgdA/CDA1 family)